MKAIDAMARILQQEGTEFIFCFPSNPLIEAGAKLGIRPIMARNERTMINMADAYTRVSNGRRIGVCVAQWGPGVENAFGAIAQAFNDSVPILFIPGGSKRDRVGASRHFDAVKNFARCNKMGREHQRCIKSAGPDAQGLRLPEKRPAGTSHA